MQPERLDESPRELEPADSVEDGVLLGGRLDVAEDEGLHLGVALDGVDDLLVRLHAEGAKQNDEGDLAGGAGDRDHEVAVLLALDDDEGAVAFVLLKIKEAFASQRIWDDWPLRTVCAAHRLIWD